MLKLSLSNKLVKGLTKFAIKRYLSKKLGTDTEINFEEFVVNNEYGRLVGHVNVVFDISEDSVLNLIK